jgi:uncharacterized membrane protein
MMKFFITVISILVLLGIIITIAFYIYSSVFRRKLAAVKNPEELGRLIRHKKRDITDTALLQQELKRLLASKDALRESKRIMATTICIISACFLLALGLWIASSYSKGPSTTPPLSGQEISPSYQEWTALAGITLLGSIVDYILMAKRLKYTSSIIDKFKELGMEESVS